MLRAAFTVILGLSVAGSVFAADKPALTPTQKEEVKKTVREYLLENPEVISEALNMLEARQQANKLAKRAEVAKARRAELINPPEGTVLANPNGDVTIVEFFDYNCGYCKQVVPTLMNAVKADPKVKLVVKEYPILGQSSLLASQAALAARKQNKYPEFHMALMSFRGQLSQPAIMETANKAGLDVKKLQEDMKSDEIMQILRKNHDLAQELGIDGTPAIFVGDAFVPGAIEKEDLDKLIADARKK